MGQFFQDNSLGQWAIVTVTAGVPANSASFGVSGITDTAVGQLTISFSRSYQTTNYSVNVTLEIAAVASQIPDVSTRNTGSVLLETRSLASALVDPGVWHFHCAGTN